jgi:hypothetical protein
MFALGLAGGVVSRMLMPAAVSASAQPSVPSSQAAVSPTKADLEAMEHRILNVVDARLEARLQPIAAHVQVTAAPAPDQTLREVRRLLAESEARQSQAMKANMVSYLQDSQQFVTKSQLNNFRREMVPGPHGVMVAFQPGSGQ